MVISYEPKHKCRSKDCTNYVYEAGMYCTKCWNKIHPNDSINWW